MSNEGREMREASNDGRMNRGARERRKERERGKEGWSYQRKRECKVNVCTVGVQPVGGKVGCEIGGV